MTLTPSDDDPRVSWEDLSDWELDDTLRTLDAPTRDKSVVLAALAYRALPLPTDGVERRTLEAAMRWTHALSDRAWALMVGDHMRLVASTDRGALLASLARPMRERVEGLASDFDLADWALRHSRQAHLAVGDACPWGARDDDATRAQAISALEYLAGCLGVRAGLDTAPWSRDRTASGDAVGERLVLELMAHRLRAYAAEAEHVTDAGWRLARALRFAHVPARSSSAARVGGRSVAR